MIKHRNIKIKHEKVSLKKANNSIVRIILIAIIVVSLGVTIGVISYTIYTVNTNHDKIISYYVLDAYAEIVDYDILGLNGDKDAIRFGRITSGNRGVRFLNISSKENALVSIYVSGEMADYISVEKNNFELEKGGWMLIPINLDVPDGTTSGNYTAKVYVKLTRP